jgi:hypothetical protein
VFVYRRLVCLCTKGCTKGLCVCVQKGCVFVYKRVVCLRTKGLCVCVQKGCVFVYKRVVCLCTEGLCVCVQKGCVFVYKRVVCLCTEGLCDCVQRVMWDRAIKIIWSIRLVLICEADQIRVSSTRGSLQIALSIRFVLIARLIIWSAEAR